MTNAFEIAHELGGAEPARIGPAGPWLRSAIESWGLLLEEPCEHRGPYFGHIKELALRCPYCVGVPRFEQWMNSRLCAACDRIDETTRWRVLGINPSVILGFGLCAPCLETDMPRVDS